MLLQISTVILKQTPGMRRRAVDILLKFFSGDIMLYKGALSSIKYFTFQTEIRQ